MIQTLTYNPNEKVLCEIKAIETTRDLLQKKIEDSPILEDYCRPFLASAGGQEFLDKIGNASSMKILDIGFGRGETSLYFASKGHEVYALEPSPLNCEILQKASKKFGQTIHVYQGTAEHFDQIPVKDFDLCLFNSSLHHCDDPVRVLQVCKNKLKKGGSVLAINEPILKFYRSKKWFYKKMETDPIGLGHYGGNEHIYYYQEYLNLFKSAGFHSVEGLPHVRNRQPRLVMEEDVQKKCGGQYVLSDLKLLIKFSILLILKQVGSKPIFALGKKLSLFPFSFRATS